MSKVIAPDAFMSVNPAVPEKPLARVIPLGNVTRLDIPPDRVLEGAKGKLESVVLVGYDTDGEIYCASSVADGGTVLWLMEQLRIRLLDV